MQRILYDGGKYMVVKKCEYCGTEYDALLTQCPLCGRSSESDDFDERQKEMDILAAGSQRSVSKPGKRLAKKKKKAVKPVVSKPKADEIYKIPRWMMLVICALLGAAVVLGAGFAIHNLGWFSKKAEAPASAQQNQQQPDAQTQPQPEQVPAADPVPEKTGEEQYMNEEDYENTHADEQGADELVPCRNLTLAAQTVSFDEPDLFYNISFTREPSNCNEPVTYASSDESVATVNQQGKIVAVNKGSAVISVTSGTQTATCIVTCDFVFQETPLEEEQLPMELNNTDMTFFAPGEQFALVVRNAPEDAEITFVSSDPSIATVSSSGLITAKSSGTITITVTVDTGDKFTSIVRCNLGESAESGSAESTKYILSNYDVTMGIQGEHFQISLKDANGTKVKGLLWTSSDTAVCTVESDGTVTAAGRGTAYVSTTYEGTGYQCIVRCSFR